MSRTTSRTSSKGNMVTPFSIDTIEEPESTPNSSDKKSRCWMCSPKKVLSLRNIIITLISSSIIIIAFIVWIIGFTASNSSTKILSDKLKDSSTERIVVMIEGMFTQAQELALSYRYFYDKQTNHMRNFLEDRSLYEYSVKNLLFSSLITRQGLINSVNFVFESGHVVGWECNLNACDYFISKQDDLRLMAYNYDFELETLANSTTYEVPNFNASIIIPTYSIVTNAAKVDKSLRKTGMFFPISRHVLVSSMYVTSVAIPYYGLDGNMLGTSNVVFYVDTLNAKVRSANPSIGGYILVLEDSGVIVAHSFANLTANMEKPCYLGGNLLVQTLCSYLLPDQNSSSISDRFGNTPSSKFSLEGFSVQRKELKFPGITWHVLIAIPDEEILGDILIQSYNTVWISALVLVAAIIFSVITTFSLFRTLSMLARCFTDIQNLDLDAPTIVKATSILTAVYELRELQNNFKSMIVTLKSIRKFVPVQIIRKILITGREASLGIEDADATIFFLDIAGFTTMSEKMEPKALVDLASSVFESCSQSINKHNGVIDKFIGDAVMALWNVPTRTKDHEYHALQSAIEIQLEMEMKNVPVRIGIHSGRVKAGNIGSVDRFSFSVLGDCPNVASRFEGANKVYMSKIICGSSTIEVALLSEERLAIKDPSLKRIVNRRLDKLKLIGKEHPVLAYQIFLSENPKHTNGLDSRDLKMYEKGYDYLVEKQYKEALSIFYTLGDKAPNDMVIRRKINLCRSLVENAGIVDGKKFEGFVEITGK
ncbi:predicted protein [Naegleria gruberi]|uniref:Predicted protein n=1 Tax=Naegleria gruberi TaxID=5762 RepID=D2V4C8_NAEGR|nr:uncharacterized protein NAEGRDRAFT_63679 [Naegleria gruberi]EFC48361.1 predicted protein [Naegleria gruberi]|eukprot:XP_002681105.1 predicted protein [Naegleria gruberi strain NEG-M]